MVETRSGKDISPYTPEQQEKMAALVRENKERKELQKQAKLKAITEEQEAKMKRLEEEMKRVQQEEEERRMAAEEEAAEEEEKERKRIEGGEGSSGTKKDTNAEMEKRISEWVANLSLGEDEEAESYIPQDEREALARELTTMEDPMERREREEEKKLEWKLRMKREKKRRREEVNRLTAEVAKVKDCRQEVEAQADDKAKWDKVLGYLEVLSAAWMEERQASWSQEVALSAMRSGFRDFARDMVTHVGGEVRRLRDNVGKFCEGAIEGTRAIAAVEGEARPRKDPVKLKFPDAYGGKKEENFDNWEASANSYVYISHRALKKLRLGLRVQKLADPIVSVLADNRTMRVEDYVEGVQAYFRLEKDGKVENVLHSLTLLVHDDLPFDIVLGMDWGEAAEATLHLREHECRLPSPSGEVKTARLFHVSGVDNTLAHCCLSAPAFARLVKKERLEEEVFVVYVRSVTEAKEEVTSTDPTIAKLLEEFEDLTESLTGVVPRPIQHRIEIESGSRTPKGAVYTMSRRELEELRKQLDELLEKVVYLDDILVFSKTLQEHQGHLRQVLEKLGEANFKSKTQVLYLGHVLDGDGIKTEDSKIAAIRDWPMPHTLTELQSFLGLANYYRRFVRNFSTIAAPLRRLLKKEAIWQWDKDRTSALKKLKRALIKYPVLKVVDPSLPFVVTTDASQYGIGVVLLQDDDNGYRPVEFVSARMPSEKVPTSTYERELYALRQALDHWKHYLLGRHFKVYSDHETLRWLKTHAKMTPKLTRWAAEIDQYDFELKPVKGKYNVVADALRVGVAAPRSTLSSTPRSTVSPGSQSTLSSSTSDTSGSRSTRASSMSETLGSRSTLSSSISDPSGLRSTLSFSISDFPSSVLVPSTRSSQKDSQDVANLKKYPVVRKDDLLAALPSQWSDDPAVEIRHMLRSGRWPQVLVVLDDDPTGTQTVHGVNVLTDWSVETLKTELAESPPCVFISTNARALVVEKAVALTKEVCSNVARAAKAVGVQYMIILRGDSTLRGHFPQEMDAAVSVLGQMDAWIIAPFFFQGGRLTINDVHYVGEGDRMIPAGETEFAKDASFGYTASNLKEWVQEKMKGRVSAKDVFSISLSFS
ncbi:hypothetical protein CBR_g29817 [Chara braunii]|uniref:RNA-directed DNA polymerase n=1 Tax=Chara braunii TaxID=69332 RepID=A0A388LBH9_CHABU|nr:hypothetical protein CBR_g29817 [Chara braunii]|eukprot:GBG79669.1 hypothetical protein CBR_g29817 [Chara braunii]